MSPRFPLVEFVPHPFQGQTVDYSRDWLASSNTQYLFIASPTGTGKSIMELLLQHATHPDSWILTPRVEIIKDLLVKIGVHIKGFSLEKLIDVAWHYGITTPLRFKNALLMGDIDKEPTVIYIDEGHHAESNTYDDIFTMMPESCKFIAFSATPYRGTPKSTAELYKRWGQPKWAITYPNAMKHGYLSMPICHTIPLVDDDILEIGTGGEFVISRVTAEVNNNLDHALKRSDEFGFWKDGKPTRPTLITVPSSGVMPFLETEAKKQGKLIRCITDQTPYATRQKLFRGCVKCEYALVHINVVSEGIDLPIRHQLDLAPCMSPVMMVQRFGRTTRPVGRDESAPVYLCTNRNIARHAYLFDGCLPLVAICNAQNAFDKPSERDRVRVFGIQTLGRLQPTHLKLKNGLRVTFYNITHMEGAAKREFLVLLHPTYADPLWFEKTSPYNPDSGEISWGKWEKAANVPTDVQGFKSAKTSGLTSGQVKAWQQNADRVGLDVEQKVDSKNVQLMFVLRDIKAKLA